MHVYDEKDLEGTRAHPWLTCEDDPTCRYYDFKQHPELIPTSLEDFKSWSHYPAIQDFYSLLAWLNGPESILESNDCAFGGVRRNISTHMSPKERQVDGRLMVFFRSLAMNCNQQNEWYLKECFRFYLARVQPSLRDAAIGLSRLRTGFKAINMRGSCLVLTFFAWGDTEQEVMGTLQHLVAGIKEASVEVCRDYREKVAALSASGGK